jgi:acetoin utilization protein AcuB
MLVHERMTTNPITVQADMSVPEALKLMHDRKIRRTPVLDAAGRLVGIVSEKDLLFASPSPTTSLSIYEVHYLMARLTVEKVMTKKIICVDGETPIEEAARIMADNKIGGLPVVNQGKLAGIITETDMFRSFLELLGGRRNGVRVTASVSGEKGTFARISSAVAAAGGDIIGFASYEDRAEWRLTLKVQGLSRDELVAVMKPVVREIIDVRET